MKAQTESRVSAVFVWLAAFHCNWENTKHFLFFFFFFNFYLFTYDSHRERERGRDTGRGRSRLHAPGARYGI